MTDTLLKIAEVAKALGISAHSVRRMVARGDLPAVTLGPQIIRYRQSDVEAIIAGNFSRQLVVKRWPRLEQVGNGSRPPNE